MSDALLAPVRFTFRAATEAFVPEARRLDETQWLEAEELAEGLLAGRPAAVGRQVVFLLRAIDVLSRLRYGRGLVSLSPEKRLRLFSNLQGSRLLLLRRGVWGLRTLSFLGYYARPGARTAIGYDASPRGWEAAR